MLELDQGDEILGAPTAVPLPDKEADQPQAGKRGAPPSGGRALNDQK